MAHHNHTATRAPEAPFAPVIYSCTHATSAFATHPTSPVADREVATPGGAAVRGDPERRGGGENAQRTPRFGGAPTAERRGRQRSGGHHGPPAAPLPGHQHAEPRRDPEHRGDEE